MSTKQRPFTSGRIYRVVQPIKRTTTPQDSKKPNIYKFVEEMKRIQLEKEEIEQNLTFQEKCLENSPEIAQSFTFNYAKTPTPKSYENIPNNSKAKQTLLFAGVKSRALSNSSRQRNYQGLYSANQTPRRGQKITLTQEFYAPRKGMVHT